MAAGWSALDRQPTRTMTTLTQSSDFVHGATYRVLDVRRCEVRPVLDRAGRRSARLGVLPREHEPAELPGRAHVRAVPRRSRQIDYVVVDPRYRRFKTNEQQLLDDTGRGGSAVRRRCRPCAKSNRRPASGCTRSRATARARRLLGARGRYGGQCLLHELARRRRRGDHVGTSGVRRLVRPSPRGSERSCRAPCRH